MATAEELEEVPFEEDFFEETALDDFLDDELLFALAFDLEDPAVRVAGTRRKIEAHSNQANSFLMLYPSFEPL